MHSTILNPIGNFVNPKESAKGGFQKNCRRQFFENARSTLFYASGSNEPEDNDFSLLDHSFAKMVIGVSAEKGSLPKLLR